MYVQKIVLCTVVNRETLYNFHSCTARITGHEQPGIGGGQHAVNNTDAQRTVRKHTTTNTHGKSTLDHAAERHDSLWAVPMAHLLAAGRRRHHSGDVEPVPQHDVLVLLRVALLFHGQLRHFVRPHGALQLQPGRQRRAPLHQQRLAHFLYEFCGVFAERPLFVCKTTGAREGT